jgi:hypothetical protein
MENLKTTGVGGGGVAAFFNFLYAGGDRNRTKTIILDFPHKKKLSQKNNIRCVRFQLANVKAVRIL